MLEFWFHDSWDLRSGTVLSDKVYFCNFHTGVVSAVRLRICRDVCREIRGHRELLGRQGDWPGRLGARWFALESKGETRGQT